MYAVFETGGLQFEASEGDTLNVPKIPIAPGETVKFDKILLIKAESDPLVGKPYIENASIEAQVVNQGKAEKVIVSTYKRRTKYRRKAGHRQPYTEIKINKIAIP